MRLFKVATRILEAEADFDDGCITHWEFEVVPRYSKFRKFNALC